MKNKSRLIFRSPEKIKRLLFFQHIIIWNYPPRFYTFAADSTIIDMKEFAVVTGAGTGTRLGRCFALELARHWNICLLYPSGAYEDQS